LVRIFLGTGLIAVGVMLFVKFVFVRESVRQRMFPVMRPLYRALNPRNVAAVARGDSRWAVVHHIGRRSGTPYDTPVDAQPTADGVIICLVYGQAADWCRNVLSAGGCTLTLDGADVGLGSPRVVTLHDIEGQLTPERAKFWRTIGIEHCLQLTNAVLIRAGARP